MRLLKDTENKTKKWPKLGLWGTATWKSDGGRKVSERGRKQAFTREGGNSGKSNVLEVNM